MSTAQVFDKLIDELKKDESIVSISLIGSGAIKDKTEFDGLQDVDLFVVKNNHDDFQREVRIIESKSFDIIYISIHDLNKLIVKDNHGWIRILSKAKHLFKRDNVIEGYFSLANKIFINGPESLNEKDINFYRFRLTNQFEDITSREHKPLEAHFLINIFITDNLKTYFKLQNTWVPRDKKLLKTLFDVDMILYELVKATLKEQNIKERIHLLEDIILYVLRPYGGMMKELEKCEVPIGTKE